MEAAHASREQTLFVLDDVNLDVLHTLGSFNRLIYNTPNATILLSTQYLRNIGQILLPRADLVFMHPSAINCRDWRNLCHSFGIGPYKFTVFDRANDDQEFVMHRARDTRELCQAVHTVERFRLGILAQRRLQRLRLAREMTFAPGFGTEYQACLKRFEDAKRRKRR